MQHARTPKEAAQILGVTTHTLDAWRKYGGGPVYVKYKHAVRYFDDDLTAFIDSHRRHHTSEVAA